MPRKIEEIAKIQIITSGELTKGWVHTHGLEDVGLPELELRHAPLTLAGLGFKLLNFIGQEMLDAQDAGKEPYEPGHIKRIGSLPIDLVSFRYLDPIPGQEDHYTAPRLALVEPEFLVGTCSCCLPKKGANLRVVKSPSNG